MKIFLLNPAYGKDFCRSARWAARSRGRVQRHPDWMLIAAAGLLKAGHEIRFVDAATCNFDEPHVAGFLEEFSPDLLVCHTTTPSIYNDIGYARLAKELTGCATCLVGPHVSALSRQTLQTAEGAVDMVARGEYDEILKDIAAGRPWKDIGGLSYRQNQEIYCNPDRSPLDVNTLPFPAWHLIDPHWYRDAGKRFPFLTLISGRGCYGRCTFCRDAAVMTGSALRMRDPRLVVDEIEYDYRLFPYLQEIMFETDTFAAVPANARAVCEEIMRRRLKVTWSCNARVDMDLSLLPLMKKAGCRMLMVGFEFGTQEALDAVKKNVRLEQSIQFAKTARRLGFTIHGCFMIGAPGETWGSAQKTIRLACSLPLDTVQFSGICVYPGTELYEWARSKGYILARDWTEWVGPDREQVTLLSYPQLSKAQIDTLVDQGLKSFYLRPRQMVKMAMDMRSWSDFKRKVFGLKSFCGYFLRSKK